MYIIGSLFKEVTTATQVAPNPAVLIAPKVSKKTEIQKVTYCSICSG